MARAPASKFERLPAEILEDIFSRVEAVRIPSMRLISRRIALSLEHMIQWHFRALNYTKRSKTLVADELTDMSTVIMGDLKQIVQRTEALERNWNQLYPHCTRPSTTWRHPEAARGVFLEMVIFYTKEILICTTTEGVVDALALQDKFSLRSSEGSHGSLNGVPSCQVMLAHVCPRAEVRALVFSYDATTHTMKISTYKVIFLAVENSHQRLTFFKLTERPVSPLALTSVYAVPRIIFPEEQVTLLVSLREGTDTALICVMFDDSSRYCVVDSGISIDSLDASIPSQILNPNGSDHLIFRVSRLFACAQRTFSLRELANRAQKLHAGQELPIYDLTENMDSIAYTDSRHQWPQCCNVPRSRRVDSLPYAQETEQQCSTYCPASSPFRTSASLLLRTYGDNGSEDIVWYIMQFYCSVDGPMTQHRFIFELVNPYLGNVDNRPIWNVGFDHCLWIEQRRDDSMPHAPLRCVLRMLEFPEPLTSSGHASGSEDIHCQEPKVCTLNVPDPILRAAQYLSIYEGIATIQVQTLDHVLHNFYYA